MTDTNTNLNIYPVLSGTTHPPHPPAARVNDHFFSMFSPARLPSTVKDFYAFVKALNDRFLDPANGFIGKDPFVGILFNIYIYIYNAS